MSPQANQYFKGSVSFLGHGALGYELMIVFAALAVWRLLTALFSFMQETRGLYLLAAVYRGGISRLPGAHRRRAGLSLRSRNRSDGERRSCPDAGA